MTATTGLATDQLIARAELVERVARRWPGVSTNREVPGSFHACDRVAYGRVGCVEYETYADRARSLPYIGETIDTAPVDGTQPGEVEHELPRVLCESSLDTVAERVDPGSVEVAGEL
jgi:hypothetical protein